MKAKMITIAVLAITSSTSHLVAQEVALSTTGNDLKKGVTCQVSPTETGFSIAFEHYTKTPIDATANQKLSKKGYDYYQSQSSYSVSSLDNSVIEVISPRDAASGMPTGKRQHKPITLKREVDKATPVLLSSTSRPKTITERSTGLESGGGAGKATYKEFTLTKRCGGESTRYTLVDGTCTIPTGDCPDGDCLLKISWTWADGTASTASDTGIARTNPNSTSFLLNVEDGVCTSIAVN